MAVGMFIGLMLFVAGYGAGRIDGARSAIRRLNARKQPPLMEAEKQAAHMAHMESIVQKELREFAEPLVMSTVGSPPSGSQTPAPCIHVMAARDLDGTLRCLSCREVMV